MTDIELRDMLDVFRVGVCKRLNGFAKRLGVSTRVMSTRIECVDGTGVLWIRIEGKIPIASLHHDP